MLAHGENLQAQTKSVAALDKIQKKDLKKERYNAESNQVNEFGFKVNKQPMFKRSQSYKEGMQPPGKNRDLSGVDMMIEKAEKAWTKAINAERQLNKFERYDPERALVPTAVVKIDGSALTADTSPGKAENLEQKRGVRRGRPASAKGPPPA